VEFKRNETEETPETFIKNFAENLYKSSIKTKIHNPLTKEMEKKKKQQKKEVSGKYKPTKKEIINYVLHLHSTKKGAGYTKKMVENKWEEGLEILKDIATNPKNPARINKTTAAILLRVLNA
jgi:hypothetical protein